MTVSYPVSYPVSYAISYAVSNALLGGAKTIPGQLRASIIGTINLFGDLQQTNKIGVALSGTAALAAGLIQGNFVGAAMAGVAGITADLTASVPNDMKFWFDGLPFDRLSSSSVPTAGVKQWFDGLPVAFIS